MGEAAAANPDLGMKAIEVLLHERSNEVQTTERVLLVAVGDSYYRLDIVEFLFRERAGEIQVTKRMLRGRCGRDTSHKMEVRTHSANVVN